MPAFVSDHDQTGTAYRCYRLDELVHDAKLIYYVGRALKKLRDVVPPVP